MDLNEAKKTIRDLLNLANDSSAAELEAENALHFARRLMLRHNVTESELSEAKGASEIAADTEYGQANVYTVGRRRTEWEIRLFQAISKLIGSVSFYTENGEQTVRTEYGTIIYDDKGQRRKGRRIRFYGPAADAQVAAELASTWSLTISAMARMRYGSPFRGEGRNYAEGFAYGLLEKVRKIEDEERKAIDNPTGPQCTALALHGARELMASKLDRGKVWLEKEQGIKLRSGPGFSWEKSFHSNAFRQGKDDGRRSEFSRKRTRAIGSVLLAAVFASTFLAVITMAIVAMSAAASARSTSLVTRAQARYSAEAALARSVRDLAEGGDGQISATIAGFEATATASADPVKQIWATAVGYGQSVTIEACAVPFKAVLPKVGAVYLDSYAELDLAGRALTINGGDQFGIATGDNATPLITQLDPAGWGQITGLEAPPSVGEVEPIKIDHLVDILRPFSTSYPSDAELSGQGSGHGILVVGGDLKVSGSYKFAGLVVVVGSVQLLGGGDNLTVDGALIVGGDLKVAGAVNVTYNESLLSWLEFDLAARAPKYRLVGVRLVRAQ